MSLIEITDINLYTSKDFEDASFNIDVKFCPVVKVLS